MFFRPVVFAYYGSHYKRRLRCQHGLPSFGTVPLTECFGVNVITAEVNAAD
jgi:hypothetical protein